MKEGLDLETGKVVREKHKVEDLKNPFDGYVYWSSMYEDLMEMVTEYLGESEHDGLEPNAGEISKDAVDDVQEWVKKRKELLRKDFLEYWNNAD